jgi:nucleoside-diphosphate-sugar epimerase
MAVAILALSAGAGFANVALGTREIARGTQFLRKASSILVLRRKARVSRGGHDQRGFACSQDASMVRVDTSPSRYVARLDRTTGRELPGPIAPGELLVHAHRDGHPLDLAVQLMASRLVELTGNEWAASEGSVGLQALADRAVSAIGAASPSLGTAARKLLGVAQREHVFRFREAAAPEPEEKARVERLRRDVRVALAARGPSPRLRVLLTGATGFLGKQVLLHASRDPHVEEVVCVVRPERVREPRTGRLRILGAGARGARLLRRLGLDGPAARKFRFIPGDVERPRLGLAAAEVRALERTITHLVHCAASVSFDDTYENSFRANVHGSRNALDFSLRLQHARRSPFVAHVAIETAYVHGRLSRAVASEASLVFPPHYYNNYYELTKAIATIETERAMRDGGLRVAQLLPSIVIGDSRTGNNHGDLKVVNAPVNAFGRVKEALDGLGPSGLGQRVRKLLVSSLATLFPADGSAELNLVPVDRVAAGVLAALVVPDAVGTRIHLATDHRIRSQDMARILREEIGIGVRLADPTVTRMVTVPVARAVLDAVGQHALARSLEKLGGIFGAYIEWGQPIHGVGNDVRILGLPARRPDTVQVFRMVCRHNRYVQAYGRIRDQDEIARRERLWKEAVEAVEFATGRPAASLSPSHFRRLMDARLDLATFERRERRSRPRIASIPAEAS